MAKPANQQRPRNVKVQDPVAVCIGRCVQAIRTLELSSQSSYDRQRNNGFVFEHLAGRFEFDLPQRGIEKHVRTRETRS